jgi:hypothetical protein
MPAIQRSAPQHPLPIEVITDAVAYCRAQGISVRIGSPGVHCISTLGDRRWEVDPSERDGAIDPIGAVLLVEQPPGCDLPDAARLALDVPKAWVAGLQDGMLLELRDPDWMASPKRAIYEHGRESGTLLRIHVLSTGGSEP